MTQLDTDQPSKVFRGSWDEILTHSDEIPKTSEVELRVFEPKRQTATMDLIKSWLEEDATDDPEEIRAAEEDLREFEHNMNLPRKEAGARLLYPEVE
jgi:uncharacterized protein YpuA (DUF1002 family)